MLFALFLSFSFGLRFLEPTPLGLPALGSVHSSQMTQTYPYSSTNIFDTNQSVVLAVDLFGCDPSAGGDAYSGKVVWYFDAPCPTLGHQAAAAWAGFQAAGAVGVLVSDGGTSVEQDSSIIYPGATLTPGFIPVIMIKYLKSWHYTYDSNNPNIALSFFGILAEPNASVVVNYERPPINEVYQSLHDPPSTLGFILYFGITLSLSALVLSSGKLAQFLLHEGGPKISIPQIVLALCVGANLILSTFLLFGPQYGSQYYMWGPAVFFITDYVPWWFAALTVFTFYLAEISLITGAGVTGLDKFKIPCVVVVATLFICEWIVGANFAAFSEEGGAAKFNRLITLLGAIYVAVGWLLTIFVAVVTFLLLKALSTTGNNALLLRFGITSAALIILIQFTILGNYFLIQSVRGVSPQWGEYSAQMAGSAGWWWGTAIGTMVLAFNFRVVIHKEIEMSKSGTSSTSSGSSSSTGSSSSSSASNDPVIEL